MMELFVGKTGFEPATPWSQTRCATGLRYFPIRKKLPKKQDAIAKATASYAVREGFEPSVGL